MHEPSQPSTQLWAKDSGGPQMPPRRGQRALHPYDGSRSLGAERSLRPDWIGVYRYWHRRKEKSNEPRPESATKSSEEKKINGDEM